MYYPWQAVPAKTILSDMRKFVKVYCLRRRGVFRACGRDLLLLAVAKVSKNAAGGRGFRTPLPPTPHPERPMGAAAPFGIPRGLGCVVLLDKLCVWGIIEYKEALRQAVWSLLSVNSYVSRKPSLARVAVFAFLYDNSNSEVTNMKSNTHRLTSFRRDPTKPPAVVQRLLLS